MTLDTNKLKWYERLKAPTPLFFKRIRKIGATLTLFSTILLAANSQFSLNFPESVDLIGKLLGYGGFIVATISSFAVDPNKLEEQQNNNNETV